VYSATPEATAIRRRCGQAEAAWGLLTRSESKPLTRDEDLMTWWRTVLAGLKRPGWRLLVAVDGRGLPCGRRAALPQL
jgi:hypothetical protein